MASRKAPEDETFCLRQIKTTILPRKNKIGSVTTRPPVKTHHICLRMTRIVKQTHRITMYLSRSVVFNRIPVFCNFLPGLPYIFVHIQCLDVLQNVTHGDNAGALPMIPQDRYVSAVNISIFLVYRLRHKRTLGAARLRRMETNTTVKVTPHYNPKPCLIGSGGGFDGTFGGWLIPDFFLPRASSGTFAE